MWFSDCGHSCCYCALQVGCHKETDSYHFLMSFGAHEVALIMDCPGKPQYEHCLFLCDNLPAKRSNSLIDIKPFSMYKGGITNETQTSSDNWAGTIYNIRAHL